MIHLTKSSLEPPLCRYNEIIKTINNDIITLLKPSIQT